MVGLKFSKDAQMTMKMTVRVLALARALAQVEKAAPRKAARALAQVEKAAPRKAVALRALNKQKKVSIKSLQAV
jgi:hypothetical protein